MPTFATALASSAPHRRAIGQTRHRVVVGEHFDAVLRLFALADVLHRAEHAHRGAARVAHHVAAILNVGVGAVPPPEAVVFSPAVRAAGGRVAKALVDALSVFGVDALEPTRKSRC